MLVFPPCRERAPLLQLMDKVVVEKAQERNKRRTHVTIGVLKRIGEDYIKDSLYTPRWNGNDVTCSIGWATSLVLRLVF